MAQAFRLGPGDEGPVGEGGIEPAGAELFGQQGRGAEDLVDGCIQVDAGLLAGVGAEQQPAFVERAAGDAEALAGQVGQAAEGRGGRRHHGAHGGGARREGPVRTGAALAGDPEPILEDHVHLAGLERHLGGLSGGIFDGRDLDTGGGVQAVGAHDIEFPRHGAEAQGADADRAGGRRPGGRCGCEQGRQQQMAAGDGHGAFLTGGGGGCQSKGRSAVDQETLVAAACGGELAGRMGGMRPAQWV